MGNKILINAIDPGECRIAKVQDNKLEEFHLETAAREITQGNIFKGTIVRIEPESSGGICGLRGRKKRLSSEK